MKNIMTQILVSNLIAVITCVASAAIQPSALQAALTNKTFTLSAMTADQVQSLGTDKLAALHSKAELLVNFWGDSILERDIFSDSNVQIDQVELVQVANVTVGYRISYSTGAWDTSALGTNCRFDGENLETLHDCKPGKIIEKSFVTEDFSEVIPDETSSAQFVSVRR